MKPGRPSRAQNWAVAHRYPLLALVIVATIAARPMTSSYHGDYLFVEMGARILSGHHRPVAGDSALHLYADNSVIQIGPPALLLDAPFQWLPPSISGFVVLSLASFAGLLVLRILESAARGAGARGIEPTALCAGVVFLPIWTHELFRWGHIDDLLALVGMACVVALLSRGSSPVPAGIALGIGTAAKPWAVILLPLLLAYSRELRPRAVLAFIASALLWWVPFVVADPGTIHALGSVSLVMGPGSTWHLLGIDGDARSWMRPLQLLLGALLCLAAVRRWGWASAPLVALSWRVVSDPYSWPYYVMGPLVAAVLWDLARPARTVLARVPWATLATAAAETWIPQLVPHEASELRLVWFVGVLAAASLLSRRSRRVPSATEDDVEPASAEFAPA